MIWCYLLKLSFVRNFHDKIIAAFSLIVLGTLKYICEIKASKILRANPLKNNSVTNNLLDSISATKSSDTINTLLLFVGL